MTSFKLISILLSEKRIYNFRRNDIIDQALYLLKPSTDLDLVRPWPLADVDRSLESKGSVVFFDFVRSVTAEVVVLLVLGRAVDALKVEESGTVVSLAVEAATVVNLVVVEDELDADAVVDWFWQL